jgi:hypothetical protein
MMPANSNTKKEKDERKREPIIATATATHAVQVMYEKTKELLHSVSIRGPLGYEPNTLPLRHGADIGRRPQNIYERTYLCGRTLPPLALALTVTMKVNSL